MLNRQILPGLFLLLTTLSALADQRSFGSMRSRDYDDRGGYYPPRHQQPVLPTRPFFVQPYPRRQGERDDHHAYRHGYQDGYDDRASRRDSRGGRHRDRRDDHHDSYGRDGGYGRNQSYQHPNDYAQPNYYGPRPGVSIYYDNR